MWGTDRPLNGKTALHGKAAQPEIRGDLFCPECGYNLRGLTSDRCPECGYSLEALRSRIPRLPWAHRAEIGRMRAYWQTVWMVMFRHKRFCEEIARPVDYRDAQRFRWVTVLHAYVPILIGTVLLYAWVDPRRFDGTFLDDVSHAAWPLVGLHVCILLFLAGATGLPSYFFHPRGVPVEQQNRAIALSYYAAAALAWKPMVFVIFVAGELLSDVHWVLGSAVSIAAGGLLLGQVFAWIADLIHVGVRVMPQRKGRLVLLAVTLPFLWLVLGCLIFFGLGFVALFLYVLAASLC